MKALKYIFFLLLAMVIVYLPFIVGCGDPDFRNWIADLRLAYLVSIGVVWFILSLLYWAGHGNQQLPKDEAG